MKNKIISPKNIQNLNYTKKDFGNFVIKTSKTLKDKGAHTPDQTPSPSALKSRSKPK